jgi:PAS domain S-box-containing protein
MQFFECVTMSSELSDAFNVPLPIDASSGVSLEDLSNLAGAESLEALREKVNRLEAERLELQRTCVRGRQTEFLLTKLYEEAEAKVGEQTAELQEVMDRLQMAMTQCNQVEAQLRAQEERLRELFYSTSDLIQSVSLSDGQITYTNEAWRQALGYGESEISQLSFVDVVHPVSYENCTAYLSQFQAGHLDSLDRVQLALLTQKGGQILVEGTISYRPEADQPSTILCIFRNTTERRQAELEIHNTLVRAQELRDLKSRFISMTSHEFRTPLAVIASSASILNDFGDRLNEEKKRYHLNCIQTYVKLTTQLLDNILLLNQSKTEESPVDLSSLERNEFCRALLEKG